MKSRKKLGGIGMIRFHLKSHSVKEASFLEQLERAKKGEMKVGLEGKIIIPQNPSYPAQVTVRLKMRLGSKEDCMYLMLQTVTVFDAEGPREELNEQAARRDCFPAAVEKLRETVKQVTEAYGMTPLELPPFAEENPA